MSQINNVIIFNKLLDQFFDFMEDKFPTFSSDIYLTKSSIDIIRKGNPRLVVEKFNEIVLPYRKQIEDCDEQFFLNFEQNIKLDNQSLLYGLKLKSIWLNSKNEEETLRNKATIFWYFQKLLNYSNL